MWLDRSTVPPSCRSSRTTSLEDLLHQWVEAGGRLVEQQQLDVGGQRGDRATFCRLPLE